MDVGPWFERAALALILVLVLWFPLSMTCLRNHLSTLPDTGTLANKVDRRQHPARHFVRSREADAGPRSLAVSSADGLEGHQPIRRALPRGGSTVPHRFVDRLPEVRPREPAVEGLPTLVRDLSSVKEFAPEPGKIMGPTTRILEIPRV